MKVHGVLVIYGSVERISDGDWAATCVKQIISTPNCNEGHLADVIAK